VCNLSLSLSLSLAKKTGISPNSRRVMCLRVDGLVGWW